MRVSEEDKLWKIEVEQQDNQLGLINIIRYLDKLNSKISNLFPEDLTVELDLQKLFSVNSELISQFVIMQSNLVRFNGRLRIVNASSELRSSFDVVMLDKIIPIQYFGQSEEDEYDDYYQSEE